MTLTGSANEAIKGLSASPITLLIAVLNVLMIGGLLYVGNRQRDERRVLTTLLIECHKAIEKPPSSPDSHSGIYPPSPMGELTQGGRP